MLALRLASDQWFLHGGCRRVGCAQDEHVGRIIPQRNALFLKRNNDAAAQFAQDRVALVGADTDLDRISNGTALDFIDAENIRIGNSDISKRRVVADTDGDSAKDGHDFIRIGARIYADVEGSKGVVARKVGDAGDLTVGDDIESAVAVAKAGEPQGQVFNRALQPGDLDHLADVVLVFDQDEDAVEHVLEDGLRAKTDADSDDACRGQQRRQIDIEDRQHMQKNDESNQAVRRGPDDCRRRTELGCALRVAHLLVGAAMHPLDEEQHNPLQNEGKNKDEDETWQVFGDKVDDVVVPVQREDLGQSFVLPGQSLEEHDYGVSLSLQSAIEQNA